MMVNMGSDFNLRWDLNMRKQIIMRWQQLPNLRRHWFTLAMAVMAVALLPMSVLADAIPDYDGRLDGYKELSPTVDGGSTALQWLLLIGLSALVFGVLFKNSNRSHLD
jgi:hypothetical protein